MNRFSIFSLSVISLSSSLFAGSASTETYHLFNPVPRDRMREMSTDRPDGTESPITVDAGHFQLEMSFFDYTRDRSEGETTETFTYLPMNLKVGLLNNVDLQFVFDSYTEEKNDTETVSGFSNLQLRMKINLWGNDGGKTALAFFPFIKIPTGTELSNSDVEGGIIVPFSIELTERVGLGLMGEIDFVSYDGEYDAEYVHTAVLGIDLTDKLGAFLEYIGTAGDKINYQAVLSGGLTYAMNDNIQWDIGARAGLNEAAPDFNIFSGVSLRF